MLSLEEEERGRRGTDDDGLMIGKGGGGVASILGGCNRIAELAGTKMSMCPASRPIATGVNPLVLNHKGLEPAVI